MYSKEVTITNKTGLHARPASEFVKQASKFKSNITLECKGKKVNAKSIINVLSVGIAAGSQILINAEGEDEKEAVEALTVLIESNFGE